MLMSRCSLEKPSSEERCLRTRSPSRIVTGRPPISSSFTRSTLAIVLLPEPDRPVKNTVKPCLWRGGGGFCRALTMVGEGEEPGSAPPPVWPLRRPVRGEVGSPPPPAHPSVGGEGGPDL